MRKYKKRIAHKYQIGDNVLLEKQTSGKCDTPHAGPYAILKINTNGTVCLHMESVIDTVNIRRITLFHYIK